MQSAAQPRLSRESRKAMVVLRATQKVLKLLPESVGSSITSTTALGDWYVNRIVVDRHPLLLLVSSTSLLSAITPARDVKGLPRRLAALIEERLRRIGIDESILASEVNATSGVTVARTVDRSVTGQMVDFAKAIPYYLPENGWSEDELKAVEDKLAETPCRAGGPSHGVIIPRAMALGVLESKWSAAVIRH
jgi:hypothetical protein